MFSISFLSILVYQIKHFSASSEEKHFLKKLHATKEQSNNSALALKAYL